MCLVTCLHSPVTGSSQAMFGAPPGTSSIIILASRCFAPFAGGMVDRISRRGSLMIRGAAGLVFALLLERADARAGAPLEHPQREAA